MVRPRAETYDQKKQEILDGAAEMFAERGFDGASIAAVAAHCGVSKALLYHYYQSKEALLYHMLLNHCELLSDTVRSAIAEEPEPAERLRCLVRALMSLYLASNHKHVVLLNNLHVLPAEQQEEIRSLERQVVGAIKDIVGELRPDLPPAERSALAMNLMGSVNWTYTWFRQGGAISDSRYADMATAVFLNGIKSDAVF
ncbi:MAG: TetR/AcrR family transcriptional regulator [Candidatus Obscuribacterales bacterium]